MLLYTNCYFIPYIIHLKDVAWFIFCKSEKLTHYDISKYSKCSKTCLIQFYFSVHYREQQLVLLYWTFFKIVINTLFVLINCSSLKKKTLPQFVKILWYRIGLKYFSWQAFAAKHGCFFWSVRENFFLAIQVILISFIIQLKYFKLVLY